MEENSQKIEALKNLIQEFSTRSNTDLYQPPHVFNIKYRSIYKKLRLISDDLNSKNIEHYDGLDSLLKQYMITSDQIFNNKAKTKEHFEKLETHLTDIEIFLTPDS